MLYTKKIIILWKTGKPASCSENVFLILSLWKQDNDSTTKNGVTNFTYFLHREFGGFTARKLLD